MEIARLCIVKGNKHSQASFRDDSIRGDPSSYLAPRGSCYEKGAGCESGGVHSCAYSCTDGAFSRCPAPSVNFW